MDRPPTETPATVLVIPTQLRAGPHVVRSLRRAGHRVVGAQPGGAFAGGRSLAYPAPLRAPSVDRPDELVAWIEGTGRREGVAVVLPTTEDLVRVLAARPPHGVVVAGPDARQYDALCDKARLAETASAAGVPHPRTVTVAPGGDDDGVPGAPCIVKPAESGEGVPFAARLALDADSRAAAIGELHAAGLSAVVQEYLEGRRWFAHAVRAEGDLRFLTFRSEGDWPRREGPASFFSSVPTPAGLAEATERLLAHVGYRGTCSLSFLESGGRLLLHDVNLRVGATVVASIRAGLDVPALTVAAVLGRALPPAPAALRPVTYVRLDGELGALRATLAGHGEDRVVTQVRRLAAGVVRRDWVLDPPPVDAVRTGERLLMEAARVARRLRPRHAA